jgi:hypothetical protein
MALSHCLVETIIIRDKYGWYQSVNEIACCCRCCCFSGLAPFSADAVCYSLLETEIQILVVFLTLLAPFPSLSKISKFHLVAGFLSNLNNNFLAPLCLFLCRQSSRHHFSASSLVVYSLLSSPFPNISSLQIRYPETGDEFWSKAGCWLVR